MYHRKGRERKQEVIVSLLLHKRVFFASSPRRSTEFAEACKKKINE